MSRALVRPLIGLLASAALASPALAADSFNAQVHASDFDHGCSLGAGAPSASPTSAGAACGTATAGASSTVGHTGVGLHVAGFEGVSGVADYATDVTFLPTAGSTATSIPIQLNLAFAGSMAIGGAGNTGYDIFVDIEHVEFVRSTSIDTSNPPSHGVMTLNFSEGGEVDDALSAIIGGVLTTDPVMAPLGAPIHIAFHLGATGFGGSGTVDDHFEHSLDFVRGRDLFTLPEGFTAEDPGAFIVDDRFLPPSSGAPEPAAWALMVAGFGLAGAALRGRRSQLQEA